MLVLTRRSKDQISFPQVGITVHFIRVHSGHVKVGVDAPREIAIVRDELGGDQATAALVRKQLLRLPREVRHGIRNELHQMSVGLHLYRELVSAGLHAEAEETFVSIQESLARLDQNEVLQRPSESAVPASGGAGKVVIIEDIANEREMLASFLRLRGYTVEVFEDGRKAIEYLGENEPPTVVLVDMKMPKFDGAETVRTIRNDERNRKLPIFAVSGTSPRENGISSGRAGVDRWFPKPLNPEYLMSAIDKVVADTEGIPS